MVKFPIDYLKVYTEQPPNALPPDVQSIESLTELLAAFAGATGWELEHIPGPKSNHRNDLAWSTPANPGDRTPLGHLSLGRKGSTSDVPDNGPVEEPRAGRLALAIDGMFQELADTEQALCQREAELAAHATPAPLVVGGSSLAQRLEAVLGGGAQAVGADAAALYLLDEVTSQLKMRSCWGLPRGRLRRPARPLAGALADLEAMLGHAVVLEDVKIMQRWNVPEDYAAAVCVPVSSPTTILGTLWIFSRTKRDFSDQETNVIEVMAGRIASDLERETLLDEGFGGMYWRQQVAAAERAQRGALPTVSPLLDHWQAAGWAAQADQLGGDFYDWFCLPEGWLAVALGDSAARGIEGALCATAVKSAIRSHAQYQRSAEQLLAQANLTLWTGSAGDQSANLFAGLVETATGRVHFGSAGQLGVLVVRPGGWEMLTQPSAALGVSPETQYQAQHYDLQPGESLVVFTDGVREALDRHGRPLGETGLAETLVAHADASADDLVELARDRLESHAAAPEKMDRAILVLKRTGSGVADLPVIENDSASRS